MIIGKMNQRPQFYNWEYDQDIGAGTTERVTEIWWAWAEIEDRTGNTFAAQATQLQRYDYRVTVRYHARYRSTTKMILDNQYCTCESMSIQNEGKKKFIVLRFSKIDS